ncbi:YdbL family protein [Nibricoccus sp. IMCC34717]|uniref:YdbL family protein n=1 Tax=Nibricoccus sp. IMCC34717 TaxID=3034021 RepID=UPI00384A89E0
MRSPHFRFFCFFSFFCFFFTSASLFADDISAIKRRSADRQSAVDAIKLRGAAGENNRGLLESRSGATAEDAAIISAENDDRSALYAEAARRSGTSADEVAKVRARKIAEMSTSGIWIEDESGRWYKK